MSSSRILTPEEQKDISDRVEKLESVWPIMQKKFQTYEDISSSLDDARREIKELRFNLSVLAEHNNTGERMKQEFSQYVQQQFDFVNEQVEKLKSGLTAQSQATSNSSKQAEALINSANDKIDMVHFNLKGEISQKATVYDFFNHSQEMIAKFGDYVQQVESLKKSHGELSQVLSSAKTEMALGKSEIVGISGKLEDATSQISALLNSFENFKTFISTSIYNSSTKTLAEVDSKLAGFKSAITAPESAINTLRTEILKKLEGVTLDGSNAVLKSTNTATQVGIIEKKIENLYLLMKQASLTKG